VQDTSVGMDLLGNWSKVFYIVSTISIRSVFDASAS